MNIMGKFPHNWYVVVVDCQVRNVPGHAAQGPCSTADFVTRPAWAVGGGVSARVWAGRGVCGRCGGAGFEQSSTCPQVLAANLTFYHPNSDGSADACSGLPQPALALKEALAEGWNALSVDNILHVAGLSPFGVAVPVPIRVRATGTHGFAQHHGRARATLRKT